MVACFLLGVAAMIYPLNYLATNGDSDATERYICNPFAVPSAREPPAAHYPMHLYRVGFRRWVGRYAGPRVGSPLVRGSAGWVGKATTRLLGRCW